VDDTNELESAGPGRPDGRWKDAHHPLPMPTCRKAPSPCPMREDQTAGTPLSFGTGELSPETKPRFTRITAQTARQPNPPDFRAGSDRNERPYDRTSSERASAGESRPRRSTEMDLHAERTSVGKRTVEAGHVRLRGHRVRNGASGSAPGRSSPGRDRD